MNTDRNNPSLDDESEGNRIFVKIMFLYWAPGIPWSLAVALMNRAFLISGIPPFLIGGRSRSLCSHGQLLFWRDPGPMPCLGVRDCSSLSTQAFC